MQQGLYELIFIARNGWGRVIELEDELDLVFFELRFDHMRGSSNGRREVDAGVSRRA